MLYALNWKKGIMAPNNNVKHIAIIMDGNRRWAEKRGLPALEGHKAGAEAVQRTVEACKEFGVKYLTLYAFSTENWKRPKAEVDGLMLLLKNFIKKNIDKLQKEGIRLRTIGRTDDIPKITRKVLLDAIKKTEKNNSGELILALSYGGRAEITDAVKKIAAKIAAKELLPEQIDEQTISENLYAPDIPDPDILIRTSGELRISNFLLWQISYSELWFTNKLWPDFDRTDIEQAINSFKSRERRFGARTC